MRKHNSLVAAFVSLTLAGAQLSTQAQSATVAATGTTRFALDIPPGDLATALKQLAQETGVDLVYRPEHVQGVKTPGVRGEFQPREAIVRLLEGTPLTLSTDATGAMLIAEPSGVAPTSKVLEEVTVRAVTFRYDEVSSATKMPTSIRDTPQSVKIVTQDLLDFASVTKFEDLYKIDASSGTSHAGDAIPRNYFRGFHVQGVNTIKVDGFRMPAAVQLDLAPYERFEIVKGSTSTLYGQNSVAGSLNAISKMPQDTFGGEVSLETGSYDHYRADLDLYGSLNSSRTLTYRLISAYQNEHEFVNFSHGDRIVLAPTLRYEVSDDTSIIARVNYQKDNFTPYYGVGAQFLGTDIGDISQLTSDNFRVPPISRKETGNSPFNRATKEAFFAQTTLDHRFRDSSWKMRTNVQYSNIPDHLQGSLDLGTDAAGFSDAELYASDSENETYAGEVNLFGDVELGGRRHTLFFGVDYANLRSDGKYYFTDLFGVDDGFSNFHPDYSLRPFPAMRGDYDSLSILADRHEMSGVTMQTLLRPLDGLMVSLGVRYSHDVLRSRSACCDIDSTLEGLAADRLAVNKFTKQLGVTYSVTGDMNLYATYGETFEPQIGQTAPNQIADPEEGTAYEIGVKGEVLGERISYSVALFNIERSNIAQAIPGSIYLALAGTQRSRGVEVDFQGSLVEGWEIYVSLAAMDAEFTKGELKGARPANAPKFGASLFTSYEIQDGAWRGLGVGAGLVHKSGREMNDLFSYGGLTRVNFLGDFTEADLRVFYTRKPWQFEVSCTNLFDTTYYSNAFAQLWTGYQANPPRQFMASMRYRF